MDFRTYLLSLFLPQVLVDYFKLVKHEKEEELLHLYFEEHIDVPKEFLDLKRHSKGSPSRYSRAIAIPILLTDLLLPCSPFYGVPISNSSTLTSFYRGYLSLPFIAC
ncbi:MAG: hypothetical protein ACI9N1_002019 [Flavobacteriales bacterium]|jgi:hypothetical protein